MRKLIVVLLIVFGCNSSSEYTGGNYEEIMSMDGSISIHEVARRNIEFIYDRQKNEIPFCLHGKKYNGRYYVTHITVPQIMKSDESGIMMSNQVCKQKDGYLGMIHNHPGGICFPSETDQRRMMLDDDADIQIIACKYNGVQLLGNTE